MGEGLTESQLSELVDLRAAAYKASFDQLAERVVELEGQIVVLESENEELQRELNTLKKVSFQASMTSSILNFMNYQPSTADACVSENLDV